MLAEGDHHGEAAGIEDVQRIHARGWARRLLSFRPPLPVHVAHDHTVCRVLPDMPDLAVAVGAESASAQQRPEFGSRAVAGKQPRRA